LPPRTLVITPTYDERDNLPELVRALHREAPYADLLVVDDASPDGTGAVADALAARDDRVKVLHRGGKLGLGTAYVAGFLHALTHGYDVAVEMDADLSHDPRHLAELLGAIEQGADLAVGSRNVPGGGVEGWGVGRHFLSKGGSAYARTILGVAVRDLTTGYKAYTRRALEAIDVSTLRSNGYSFQIETTYRALRRGLRVVEVPIVFVDRRVGKSKLSRRIFAEAIVEVWRLRLEALRQR
jgi:dolichol-phosphate mannosyltransferase